MKTIKFSQDELEFLRNHYEMELLEAEDYIADIKHILNKLGADHKPEPIEKPKKKRGRPRKTKDEGRETKDEVKNVEIKEKKKPGPKIKKVAKKAASKKKTTPKKKEEIKPAGPKPIPVVPTESK